DEYFCVWNSRRNERPGGEGARQGDVIGGLIFVEFLVDGTWVRRLDIETAPARFAYQFPLLPQDVSGPALHDRSHSQSRRSCQRPSALARPTHKDIGTGSKP